MNTIQFTPNLERTHATVEAAGVQCINLFFN